MAILVTGGAGFIGANFVLDWLRERDEPIVNLDKLTYAGNLASLASVMDHPRHAFVHGDIGDALLVSKILTKHKPRAVVHLAAESHADRSIHAPDVFVQTNIVGTSRLLEAVRAYCDSLTDVARKGFRFINVSTDEVFGSLGPDDTPFRESTAYAPNNPYAASKAAADHLCRAYFRTYGVPTITTHCSNNYGPYQFPEKLIPLMIRHAVRRKALPIYGDGANVRDWLYVSDHCAALRCVLDAGAPGESYNVGGNTEIANIDVVNAICDILDELIGHRSAGDHRSLITFVADRPGHDRRYAIDSHKIHSELGWRPSRRFASGLRETVEWFLANEEWAISVESGEHRQWLEKNYPKSAEGP